MKENEFKPLAKNFLSGIGLTAHDIPPKEGCKTPDFDVEGKSSRYTIELKIKSDDPEEIKHDLEILSQGKILNKSTSVTPRNRLYAIIKEGVQQMEEHDPENKTYHVLWIHSAGQDPDLLRMRFHATLFGNQHLISAEKKCGMTCYFFNESVFYTHRTSLDGAILTYNDQLQLCVNTLSPRKNDFQQSDLYMGLSHCLCDPDILQKEEGVMIADCDIDRQKESEVIKYLKDKYSLGHLQTVDMKQYSGMIAVPKDNN